MTLSQGSMIMMDGSSSTSSSRARRSRRRAQKQRTTVFTMPAVLALVVVAMMIIALDGVVAFSASGASPTRPQLLSSSSSITTTTTTALCLSYDAAGDYYGESSGSFMVKEFAEYEQLEEIVKLASQALPERPDGICAVAKYTSAVDEGCKSTEAEYERMARNNPATIFLRCFREYDNADILIGKANIQNWPTFDVFYGGMRVARVEGGNYAELEEVLKRYQFLNSKLDLFSESAANPWGDRTAKGEVGATPRTTNRFIPGYDWNTDKGFFDTAGERAVQSFEDQFENSWLPTIDDDENEKK